MKLSPVAAVNVGLDFGEGVIPVGRLATRDRRVYFEYDRAFLARGLEISPYRLALRPGLQNCDPMLFEGLPGVFNDSLPDGWGRLLFDRALRASGVLPEQISPLDRLTHVGARGMGALVYEPDHAETPPTVDLDLDRLAEQSQQVLQGEADEVLSELIALNGSSTGARPKAMIGLQPETGLITHGVATPPQGFEAWLVKFPNSHDGQDAGAIEYIYALMAEAAGLVMTKTRLLTTDKGGAYFATQRFDRNGAARVHTHTASGLLHADHRIPSLDYERLIALTSGLTRDVREVEKMFRLAVFNVFAHNRDDHAKNFTFLMNDQGEWSLSPAYDLTFSSGPGAEQTTTVMGQGKTPSSIDLRKLAEIAGLASDAAQDIIDQTRDAVRQWPQLAARHHVTRQRVKLIAERLDAIA
ncbi:type II toxin-antitoxin system HipA family toxin [Caulobacter segnis]|uniref:type II toxin-antitoxin system HipA family toxin n=1 Tax=Caulobacter segnis TaxID=88688 RepID=UPI00240F7C0A|nr:type II toxin-antitoxin system HipA family toxin [Caulobacter segnis]MDG2520448.1 type II toxin-antitoxin system HipA family toxin [Caulobacter segnis]